MQIVICILRERGRERGKEKVELLASNKGCRLLQSTYGSTLKKEQRERKKLERRLVHGEHAHFTSRNGCGAVQRKRLTTLEMLLVRDIRGQL